MTHTSVLAGLEHIHRQRSIPALLLQMQPPPFLAEVELHCPLPPPFSPLHGHHCSHRKLPGECYLCPLVVDERSASRGGGLPDGQRLPPDPVWGRDRHNSTSPGEGGGHREAALTASASAMPSSTTACGWSKHTRLSAPLVVGMPASACPVVNVALLKTTVPPTDAPGGAMSAKDNVLFPFASTFAPSSITSPLWS